MAEKIILNIVRHLTLTDSILSESKNILRATLAQNVDLVIYLSNNRDRLVAITNDVQTTLEQQINELTPKDVSKNLIETISSWCLENNTWLAKIDQINCKITELLEKQKEETTKEIATLFKNQEQFKGYNLNNTKK